MAAYRNLPPCSRGMSPASNSCPSPITMLPESVSRRNYSSLADDRDSSAYCPGQDNELWQNPESSPCADVYPDQEEPLAEVWETPMLQTRNVPTRRFSCRRRLTYHDVKEWVLSGTEELDGSKVDEITGEPPPAEMLEHQRQELSSNPDDEYMETVYGPLPLHIYVPLWVYFAREQYPDVFQEALTYYFENTEWPELRKMDRNFQEDCENFGISEGAFRKTAGFAPVWVFILDNITKSNIVHRRWFEICLDHFFEDGIFPEMASMPGNLHKTCQQMGVTEYDFYVPKM